MRERGVRGRAVRDPGHRAPRAVRPTGRYAVRVRRILLLSTLLLACESHERLDAGPPEWEPPTARSGTRLRRRFAENLRGDRQFVGWYDTALGSACTFRRSQDGVLRCHPGPVVTFDAYADAACTEPALEVVGCEPLPFVHRHVTDGCPEHWRTLRLAGTVLASTVPADSVHDDRSGDCEPHRSTGARSAHHRYVAVDDAELVAGEVVVEPTDARVAGTWIVTEDGASEQLGFHDTLRDERCVPYPSRQGGVCVPESAVPVREGFGAGCDDQRALLGPCDGGADLAFRFFDECPRLAEARSIGPAGGVAGCSYDGEPHAEEPAPADAMGPVSRQDSDWDRGLIATRYVTSHGVRRFETFRTTEWGAFCTPGTIGGEPRCVPASFYDSLELFADETCTDHAFFHITFCDETFLIKDSRHCGAQVDRLFEITPDPVRVAYDTYGGRCARWPLGADGLRYLEEADTSSMSPLTVVTE